MTDQRNNGSWVQDPSASNSSGDNSSGNGSPRERWLRRPRRSTGDRKIAGVAGGLGRAFGVDPVLIRVAFVVLTIFGGFGGLLYVLGWLLLPADGDEVSAAEALLGRGRSSVPPPLAVGLGIVAVIAAFSMFSWGLPFLPLAIGGVIVLAIMRKRRRHDHHAGWGNGGWSRGHWPAENTQEWTSKMEQWAAEAREAGRAARQYRGSWQSGNWHGQWQGCGSRRSGSWGGWTAGPMRSAAGPTGPTPAQTGTSPFEQPPFWEQPATDSGADRAAPTDPTDPGVNMTKQAAPAADQYQATFEVPTPRTTPPEWDPLGVAPFAWDLPEPTPLPTTPPPRSRSASGVVGRVTMGATLLVGALTAVGVLAGWWTLTWAQVSAIALGVLAVGLLVSALRGRGYSLIGPGIFLSLVTLALAVTGISGTTGFGATTLTPTYAQLQNSYTSNAGELRLDLSSVSIPKGVTKTVEVDLKGGHAEVVVPDGMNVVATCAAEVGQTDCLGNTSDGVRRASTGTTTGNAQSGTLNLDVKVNAGFAEVNNGG